MNDEDVFRQHTHISLSSLHVASFGFRNDETGRILSIIMQDMLIKDYHEIRIPLRQGSSTTISSAPLAISRPLLLQRWESRWRCRVYRECCANSSASQWTGQV